MAASREPHAITSYHQKPRHKATISSLYQERSSLLDFATTHEPPPTNDACEAKMAPASLTAAQGRDPLGRAPGLRPGSQRGWLWDPQKGRFLHRSDNKLRLSRTLLSMQRAPASIKCWRRSQPVSTNSSSKTWRRFVNTKTDLVGNSPLKTDPIRERELNTAAEAPPQ